MEFSRLLSILRKIIELLKSKSQEPQKEETQGEVKIVYIKQNDSRLKEPIPDIGCFFRSCGLIAEMKVKKALTDEQINELWDWAKGTGRINENDDVRDSASIATRALRVLGDKGRFIEVGLFKDGITQFYPAYKNTDYARIDALIQKIKSNGRIGTHFRVVGKSGTVLEDPHEPPIKEYGIFYSILYCYCEE